MATTRSRTPLDRYVRSETAQVWAPRIEALATSFAPESATHDRDATVAKDHVQALVDCGYTAFTAPVEAGGSGASLYDLCLMQTILAMGDAATALGLGWHLSLILGLRVSAAWPDAMRQGVMRETVRSGALVNSIATEAETGSPSRGGRPTTTALAVDGGYRLNGRKTFATWSPILRWFLVSASLEDGAIGEFLIEANTSGVRVDETWDSLAMRATESHDVVLADAIVPASCLVERYTPPERSRRSADVGGPLLHVPACYLGIAYAARRDLLRFAWSHRPNSLTGPIAELPGVVEQVGAIEVALLQATALVFDAAEAWDRSAPAGRASLRPTLTAAKLAATEAAVQVTDRCMRIVGGLSLSRRLPFERHFRDARAGLHNPPPGDVALRALGQGALAEARP